MAQHDFNIANATFPSVRSDINSVLSAINSTNSGSSRPSSAVAGTIWLDTSGAATAQLLKMYDGAADITLATVNFTANTVDFTDSSITLAANSVDSDNYVDGSIDLEHLAADSVNATKIADNSISEEHLDVTAITGHSAETSIADGDFILIHDASASALKKMTKANFVDGIGGGVEWQSSIVTASTLSAVSGRAYWINTTSNACTITLPGSASVGDQIIFTDYARKWGTNAVTINQNSLKFQGNTSPNPIYNTSGQSVDLVYSGTAQGWIPNSDDVVSLETPQFSGVTDFLVIAGGGGAGADRGAGGGAGGYRCSFNSETSGGGGSSESSLSLTQGTQYTVTVGGGGAGQVISTPISVKGNDSSITGSNITDIVSEGGGRGGNTSSPNQAGGDGGSGGGGHANSAGIAGGSGTSNQGFNGAVSQSPNNTSGGGGGAGEAGGTDGAGYGGDGLSSSITGSAGR